MTDRTPGRCTCGLDQRTHEQTCHLGDNPSYMCPAPAITTVTGGCVHEHVWSGPACAMCAWRAVAHGGSCGVCREPDEGQGEPHECRMIFRREDA